MRKLLFATTLIYTVLLITRPHEFVPALAEVSLLQPVLLAAFGVWLFIPDKGAELAQFRIIPIFLVCVWLSLGFGGWWGGIVPALERLVPPILLFVILTGCVRSVRELRQYSFVIIVCASILVLHGHLQRTTGSGWTGQPMIQGRITYSGIFNDPNDMGLLIVLAIALSIFHLRSPHGTFVRILLYGSVGWLLYGVYLTDSRGTMLSVLVVLGLEVWRSYGKTLVMVGAACAIPVLLAFTRLAELDAEEASAGNRVDAWYEGIQMLIDNPIFGVGWGMFSDYHTLTAHNSFVLAMAELGMLGYTFWFALVFITGWMILKLAFPGSGPDVEALAAMPAKSASWASRATAQANAATSESAGPRPMPAEGGPPRAFVRDRKGWGGASTAAVDSSIDVELERLAARTLLFAAIGFIVGAFFLSQSYKPMLFINCGLIVGRYLGMRELGIPVQEYRLSGWLPVSFVAGMVSLVVLWLMVRILV